MEFQVKTIYNGGIYDSGLSDIYDGAKSLNGFSRTISIVTHAFINEDVIYRATALKGAKIYRKASRKGSFIELFVVVIENPFAQAVAGAAFYDFMKYTIGNAAGKIVNPETHKVKKIVEKKEPFISQLSESLEEPLKEMHRPIATNREVTIDINRIKNPLIRMDRSTYDYLHNDVLTDLEEGVIGNVTKFNTLTGYGRIYLDEFSKTFPFKIDEYLGVSESHLITWSLDESYKEM